MPQSQNGGSQVHILDRSLHATYMWLDDICHDLDADMENAYQALRAVLHALRDNLPAEHNAKLGTQLPTIIRGIYYAAWDPSSELSKDRSKKKFIERVEEKLGDESDLDAQKACQSVFQALDHHIDRSELEDIRNTLSKPVRALWPEDAKEDESQESDKAHSSKSAKKDADADAEAKADDENDKEDNSQDQKPHSQDSEDTAQSENEEKAGTIQSDEFDEDKRRSYDRSYEDLDYERAYYRDEGYEAGRRARPLNPRRPIQERGSRSESEDRPDVSRRYKGPRRDDFGRAGGGPQYTSRGYAMDYPYSESARGEWNDGRRMSGSRQSYGYEEGDENSYENAKRWRDRR